MNHFKFIACFAIVLASGSSSVAQVVAKDPRVNPFGNTNQPPSTASRVQVLTEMLQYLPEGSPCNQQNNTFGVLATRHAVSNDKTEGYYSPSSATKERGQLTFIFYSTPLGSAAVSNGQAQQYRIFVENGQVCMGINRDGGPVVRNIQVIKLIANAYSMFWYTQSGVVVLTFGKKRTQTIC